MEITLETVVFYFLAAFITVFSILTVTTHRMVRSATYLLFVLFGTAGIYFLLGYTFLGSVQIMVYAGGIVVLYVFSILLTSGEGDVIEKLKRSRFLAGLGATVGGAIIVVFITLKHKFIATTDVEPLEVNIKTIGHHMLSGDKLRHIERNSLLLFMVPADSDDIRKEYEILLNELRTFNPEMLDKQRVLAVTKCDMLDQELMDEIEPTLPENIPHVFISAISGMGISVLKDLLWEELNKESNKIEGKVESIAHRAKDMSHLKEELKEEGEDEDLNYEYIDDEDIEDLEDFEYEEEDWEEDGK